MTAETAQAGDPFEPGEASQSRVASNPVQHDRLSTHRCVDDAMAVRGN